MIALMPEMVIRKAGDPDAAAIFALYHELDGAYKEQAKPGTQQEKTLWQAVAADEHQTVLVAEQGGNIIGTLTLLIVPNLAHHGKPWAAVENVVVAGGFRGLGIGKALLTEAARLARELSCYKLVLSTNLVRHEAHEFYRRLGWRQSHIGFSLPLD
ncbi:MAG: GNAT family N-acetyltransferase [Negativicutes bacterium]|nr:GNAT family N-acetyltransferase [Negativicutes bacterium]